jgi:subtilisin family serine protease
MIAALLFAVAVERTTTLCATRDVAVTGSVVDKELIACGESFADNTLWPLDRADNVMDGFAARVTRGKGAVVYVVDTGVERNHDEFQRDHGFHGGSNVIDGLDPIVTLSNGTNCAGDTAVHPCYLDFTLPIYTHGTAVASVIAGKTTGIAPDASIVSVRVQADVKGNVSQAAVWLRALDDIVQHASAPSTPAFRTAIVNMSASPGFTSASDPQWLELERKMKLMIEGANGRRFLFVTIAGNRAPEQMSSQCTASGDPLFYPSAAGGAIDGLITAGGIDRQNKPWASSCTGADILAPAEGMLVASISANNRYRGTAGTIDVTSGTSYAAPYVAGIAARMLESDPNLSPVELERRIKANASAGVAVLVETTPPPRRRAVRR